MFRIMDAVGTKDHGTSFPGLGFKLTDIPTISLYIIIRCIVLFGHQVCSFHITSCSSSQSLGLPELVMQILQPCPYTIYTSEKLFY